MTAPGTRVVPPNTVPPHDEPLEQAVLSAMLLDERVIDGVAALLPADAFYRTAHRLVFEAIVAVHARGAALSPFTLATELADTGRLDAAGGREFIGYLLDAVPGAANVLDHAAIVRAHHARRTLAAQLQQAAHALTADRADARETAQAVFSQLLPFTMEGPGAKRGFVHVKDDLWPILEELEARRGGGERRGIPTGYPELDDPIGGGLQSGELMFLAAVPGGLKTAVAINIALNVADEARVGAAIVSAEMTRQKLHERNLATVGRVPFAAMRSGAFEDDHWPRLANAAGRLSRLPLWVDQTPRPAIGDVMAKCRALKGQHAEIGLVVVDFIQLLQRSAKGSRREEENRSQELTDICYSLAGLAKELEVAMIATCQVDAANIEKRDDKRPRLGDLRWSQAMREAGHFVGLLYRPKMYTREPFGPDTLEIDFAKARDAEPFRATLLWEGKYMRVDSLKRRAREEFRERTDYKQPTEDAADAADAA